MARDRVLILDTTLRDGEQTPGVSLTPEEKLEIGIQLDKLGVDVIEAGFPITSKGEIEGVKLLAHQGLQARVCGLARTERSDIDAALQCGVNYIHTFIATSELHMKYKLKLSREEVLRKAVEAVEYAKSHGVTVEFSAEDATRSDPNFMIPVYKAVVEAGADRLDIPDTVGVMTPERMAKLVSQVKEATDAPISVHCHDDFGLSVANTIAGITAGATEAHLTINGIGERAGNTSLEEVVMALHNLYRKKTGIKTELIYQTSQLVSRLTGIPIQPNKAIVGDNAFGHESGIHTHGVLNMPATYEPLEPALVGRTRWIQAGKHAGSHGIRAQLEQMRVFPSKEELSAIVSRIKDIADKGKSITDADLAAIAESIMGKSSAKKLVELSDLAVITGTHVVPTASVKLIVDGKAYVAAETGVGPVDSAVKAIQKVVGSLVNVRLKEYRLEAITGGTDALADVIVKMEDSTGNFSSGRAVGEDIVVVSVQAMIEAISRLLVKGKVMKEGLLKE